MATRKSVTDQFRDDAQDARNVIHEILTDGQQDPKHRLRAAEMTLDRSLGKAAQGVIMIPLERAIAKQLGEFTDADLLRIGQDAVIPGEAEYKSMAKEAPVDGEFIAAEDDPLVQ